MAHQDENEVLVHVLRMALSEEECRGSPADGAPVVYLETLSQELKSEGHEPRMAHDIVDRALMTRLADAPVKDYPQAPFQYLLGCCSRADDKLRSTNCGALSPVHTEHMRAALTSTLEQLANFIWLTLVVKDIVWQPDALRQRGVLQVQSALASLFSISYLPDAGALIEPAPSVRAQCFVDVDIHRPSATLLRTIESLRQASKALVSGICSIISPKGLLAKEARPQTLRFLAALLRSNTERAKMQFSPLKASSDGVLYNLCCVLMNLCEPFMDPSSGKVYQFATTRYLANTGLVHFEDETRLAATSAEFKEWQAAALTADPAPAHHFICECFYMTARAIHIGHAKMVESLNETDMRQYHHMRPHVDASDTSPQGQHYAREFDRLKHKIMASQAALTDPDVASSCFRWCKLCACWLLHAATGVTSPSAVQLPLPVQPPADFKVIPEFLLEDMCWLLKNLAQHQVPNSVALDEVVLCCTALMSAPTYVTNPYLRYRMVEVLFYWMPESAGRRPDAGLRQRSASPMEYLFTCHPAIVKQLVPGLLLLYQDIEYTDRAAQFYEKFSMRSQIAELLAWLWDMPQHRDAWVTFANIDQGRGVYMRFLNYVVQDCTYLLDEAMGKLPEVKKAEAIRDDPQEWAKLNPQEQAEHTKNLKDWCSNVKFYLQTAGGFIRMLIFTSAVVAAPMLLEEMVDPVANMLNYFLKHLTGSERAKLKVKNPEKLGFNPKELLASILMVFINLGTNDKDGAFVGAVARDGRSYRPENFSEAVIVAKGVGLPDFTMAHIESLQLLSEQAAQAFAQQQIEDEMQDVPDDFLDPVMSTLMKDPVKLPSGNTMERGSILRHLLSDPRDPFSRAPLQPEDLVPDVDMRARISQWLRERAAAPPPAP